MNSRLRLARRACILGVTLLVLCACGAASPAARARVEAPPAGIPIAITIDDLPFVGPLAPGASAASSLRAMLDALAEAQAPVTGFVVCQRLHASPDALAEWIARQQPLANHSTTHVAPESLSEEAWRADVQGCRDELAALTGAPPRYFRYPMLRTGETRARRDAGFAVLEELGQVRAPVSVDTSEWVLAAPYAEALRAGDEARAASIAEAYVAHLRRAARHYRAVARERVGRDIAHILLLHANALAADHLQRVLAMLRQEGFRFVSLEEALSDPVYAMPDDWVDPVGASWLYRLAPATPEAWGWDRGQEEAMRARFAETEQVADAAPERIGRSLSALRIEGLRAWRITDHDAVDANSLVVVTDGGTPIMADTPWTPQATRELLDWIEARFGRLPTLATISHFHFDAAGGIAALRDAGVRVVASRDTARALRERGEGMRAELTERYGALFADMPLGEPDVLFDPAQGYTERVDELEVRVVFPGAAHTPDNVVTLFTERALLFGGCMIKGGDSLGYLGDAVLADYPASAARVGELGASVVVPGHGERLDAAQIEHTRELVLRALSASREN